MLKSKKTTILLAEDHPLMRKAIRVTLEEEEDLNIIDEAKDGQEAIDLAGRLLPDLIIMDISMPLVNGLEATTRIKSQHPNILILILTVYDDAEHIMSILQAGADGYLTKEASDQDLINAIFAVISGEAVIAKPVFRKVLIHSLGKPAISNDSESLTNRELEILRLAASGLNNNGIGSKLSLSPFTVKNHMVEIFSKLNVSSRTEAVAKVIRSGLIKFEDL